MRHGKKFNHLSRKTAHRKAMLSNMACSLIEHKRINTTIAKAKALRVYVEPILTKSKTDSTHSRRTVFSYLQNKEALSELFREIAPKIADRPGGYTRIIRTGYRVGDNAEMCMIELVDFNDVYTNEGVKKTTRRSRRGSGGAKVNVEGAVEATEVDGVEEVKVDAIVETEVKETPTKEEKAKAAPKAEVKEEVKTEEKSTETEAKVETTEEAPAKEEKAKEEKPKAEAKPKAEKKAKEDAPAKTEAPKKEDDSEEK